ncbi:hypothetical protein SPRG_08135 [Saprolegnia parasitica CBS 223.65]|uniref:Signal peptidase complex catalytic subunit SEC11 n=1 Tax=Saprolegnia parasitica (strain CBS 223.65) TaxID=695850 RepID=A0A067C7U9_SAPPC|nr:hypothetical protein SPRG_08135 [Saprolegnia parasitica CBS 223.65]KDO26844.1 hypothetical protein SPRG_08135 [Saprolegnia parasitica CBS 223.65]|eukprot:XP_012202490.1 hypothetical protein SPRG_08135 [Saprolegnia parasitica CBS 223.65]
MTRSVACRRDKRRHPSKRWFIHFILRALSGLVLWRGIVGLTCCESPAVVVLSGSVYQRGDILFLGNSEPKIDIGDTVVFTVKDRDIPIAHRVLQVHTRNSDGVDFYLTKGDDNSVNDRGLYAPGQLWLPRGDIVGVVRASIPCVGMTVIFMNDYPLFKILAIGLIARTIHGAVSSRGTFHAYGALFLLAAGLLCQSCV